MNDNLQKFSRKSKNPDVYIQITYRNVYSLVVLACSDSPFPIDIFISFPRILCHRPHPVRLVWLRTCFGCLAKGSRRCHLSLHVHNLASGVCGFKYWLFLTHHGQSFLQSVTTAVSVCQLNVKSQTLETCLHICHQLTYIQTTIHCHIHTQED